MLHSIFENVRFLNEKYDPHDPKSNIETFGDLFKAIRYKTGKLNKKDLEYEKAREEQKRKEEHKKYTEEHKKKLKQWKDDYNITIQKVNIEYSDPKKFYNDIIMDCKSWLSKIINSTSFKEEIEQLLNDEKELDKIGAFDPGMPKPSLSHYKSIFKIKEGVNGWEETIQVCEGSQEECIYFNWVTYTLADMIDEKYDLGCDCGDGDEGHIYYDIYR